MKIYYAHLKEDVFYKKIYPLFAKEFLFENDFGTFAEKVSEVFILNPEQWEHILEHWRNKQIILKYDEE